MICVTGRTAEPASHQPTPTATAAPRRVTPRSPTEIAPEDRFARLHRGHDLEQMQAMLGPDETQRVEDPAERAPAPLEVKQSGGLRTDHALEQVAIQRQVAPPQITRPQDGLAVDRPDLCVTVEHRLAAGPRGSRHRVVEVHIGVRSVRGRGRLDARQPQERGVELVVEQRAQGQIAAQLRQRGRRSAPCRSRRATETPAVNVEGRREVAWPHMPSCRATSSSRSASMASTLASLSAPSSRRQASRR